MRWEAELKVGVFVAVGFVLLVIVLTLSSDWHVGIPGEELTLRFDALSNVKGGGDVQLAGVHIGKVVGIGEVDNFLNGSVRSLSRLSNG